MSKTTPSIVLFSSLLVAACGPAPGTRAHDDSAAGHRAEAAEHQEEADLVFESSKLYYKDLRVRHENLAAAHMRAAVQLEEELRAACEGKSREQIAAWAQVQSIDPVDDGVLLHVADKDRPPAEILADLRCHRAAMARDGFDRHADDPLAMRELDIVVHPEPQGTAIMLGVEGDAELAELRRRAATLITVGRQ
jgi:hypothetical protein